MIARESLFKHLPLGIFFKLSQQTSDSDAITRK